MKFLADMCISMKIVEWLRSNGHEALHLREEGLQRLPDGEVFLKARREGRILITHDLDFGEIVAGSEGASSSGIIFLLHRSAPKHAIPLLDQVIRESASALGRGSVIIVEDRRYRVRLLPIN